MTKFYLHSASSPVTGTLPTSEQSSLTADANLFTGEDGTANRKMDTTIGVSQANLTNASTADTNAHNYYIARFVSPLLYQSRIDAKTWTLEYGAKESNAAANFPRNGSGALHVNCYIWKPSTGEKVGTIIDGNTNADGEEAGTSQSVINCTFSGAAVTGMIPGDAVLIVELWAIVTQGNGSSRTQDIYFDGTTENSTSNEAAFLSTPEDLQLAPTSGSATLVTGGGSVASTANTTQYWPLVGRPSVTITESEVEIPIRKAGTFSKLSIYLGGNSVASGTTTFTLRKNGADTALVANITASGAQLTEDLTNTVHVNAGDKICLKTVPGAATGTFTIDLISINFVADDEKSCQILGASRSSSLSSASVTRYIPLGGDCTPDSTEAEAKIKQKKTGYYQYIAVYVISNTRTTDTVFKSRKNGANGNLSITFGNGEVGLKEDIVNIDTVAVDDDYNFGVTTGTGTGTITYAIISIHFFADDQSGCLVSGNLNTITLAANLTRYQIVGDNCGNYFSNESDTKRRIRLTRMTVVGIQCYLVQNSVSATSTLKLRKNGADANNAISITSNTPGFYQDNAHEDEFYSGDDMDLQIITGATGTQIEISQITIFYKLPRITKLNILKWNMLERKSKELILKWNIIARISKQLILKWNILSRISKQCILLWNILVRLSKESILKWNIASRVSKELILLWNMLERKSKELILKWNVANLVSKEITLIWNILQRLSKESILKWNIVSRVSKQLTLLWNILERKSKETILKWNIVARVSKELTLLWNIVVENLIRISAEFILKWNIVGRVSKEIKLLWNILERKSKELTIKWNITTRVSKELTLLWNILSRVSKETILKWNILERKSKEFILKWNILGRISKEIALLWNIIEADLIRISKEFILKWDILERRSKEFILKWGILARISKELVLKWNIIQRLSKEITLLWNIINTIRISKEVILKWNISVLAEKIRGKFGGSFVVKDKIPGRGIARMLWDRIHDGFDE